MAEVKIQGLDQVRRRLRALPKNMRNRELGKALRAGGKLVRDDARRLVPVDTGLVQKNVAMRTSTGRRAGNADVKVRIGVLSDRSGRDSGTDAFYWVFQEFGTSRHPAQPFLRPAFESNKYAALNAITSSLRKGITRQAKKR